MQTQAVSQKNDAMLRNTLFGNVGFTLISLLLFLFASQAVADLMGISYRWVLVVLGLGFIPFAGFVFWVASSRTMNTQMAKIVIALDFGWVLLSYGYLIWAWSDLMIAGRWFVFIQAEAVFLFGLFQYLGLRRLR
ncbi:MAG: hypothetical protein AAF490_29065 [Chloroflexota bacterium]